MHSAPLTKGSSMICSKCRMATEKSGVAFVAGMGCATPAQARLTHHVPDAPKAAKPFQVPKRVANFTPSGE